MIDVNVISNMLTLETEAEVQIHVNANQLKLEGICRKHGVACNMSERNCQPLIADPNVQLPDTPEDEEPEEDEDVILDDDATVITRPPQSQPSPPRQDRSPTPRLRPQPASV